MTDLKDSHVSLNSANMPGELTNFLNNNNKNSNVHASVANMRASRFSVLAGDHGLTQLSGAMALVSTCVGGGIVGIPLASYNLGLPLAVVLQGLVVIITIVSASVYLALKDIIPDKPESLYEIGYMVIGRPSIFFLAIVLIINAFGLCMLYFIVFGDTAKAFVASITQTKIEEVYYTSRWFYDVILAAILLPIVIKKELAELAWVSYVLFTSLSLFVLLNFILLVIQPNFDSNIPTLAQILTPKIEFATLSAINVMLLAFSYQQNLFPIFSELKNKTNAEYMKTSTLGLIFTWVIYVVVAILGVFMFGSDLKQSILDNIGEVINPQTGRGFWETYIEQSAFMLVLMCHVPFIFFSGKEGLLIIIDEWRRKSISSALWHKLQTNNHFSMRPDAQEVPNPDLPIPGDSDKIAFASIAEKDASIEDMSASDDHDLVDVDKSPADSKIRFSNNSMMKSNMRQSRMTSRLIMSHMSAAVAQRLAYKEMSNAIYYPVTIIFYAVIVFLGILIQDIEIIFNFVGAISVSCVAFLVPGYFYLVAYKKFPLQNGSPHPNQTRNVRLGYLFLVLGFINFCIGTMSGVLVILGIGQED